MKQQEKDKKLSKQLKLIHETGVMGARIQNGKVIKKTKQEAEKLCFFSSQHNNE
jgi:hypothetical protein